MKGRNCTADELLGRRRGCWGVGSIGTAGAVGGGLVVLDGRAGVGMGRCGVDWGLMLNILDK